MANPGTRIATQDGKEGPTEGAKRDVREEEVGGEHCCPFDSAIGQLVGDQGGGKGGGGGWSSMQ